MRDQFLKLIDRPLVPLQPADIDGIEESRFTFQSEKDEKVFGVIVKPPATIGKRPVVIALHGTGGKKEDMLPFLSKMADRGFMGISIDGRLHGQRCKAGTGSVEYQQAIFNAWQTSGKSGHPFFYDTVWDIMRLIDYLQTRDDVDASKICLYGISKGGIEAYLAAAADPRIAAVVPGIAMQSFDWALKNNAWQSRISTIQPAFDLALKESTIKQPDAAIVKAFYDRVVPGITDLFDGPSIVKSIAPRPMLLINGQLDDRTPLAGLQLCIDSAKEIYHNLNASDRFDCIIQKETGHTVKPESEAAAIEWLVRMSK